MAPLLVVLKPRSHCVRRCMSTHSACTHGDVRRRIASHRRKSMQDTADAKIICYLPSSITSPAQRNDGRQRNVRRRSVCDCCRKNRLKRRRRRFSLVTNIVAVTRMRTGCGSSHKFLETQVISSSLDGWTVA